MKKMIALLMVLVLVIGLVACSNQSDKQAQNAKEENVTLTFWVTEALTNEVDMQTPEEEWLISKLCRKFEDEHPGVTIDMVAYPNGEEVNQLFKAAAMSDASKIKDGIVVVYSHHTTCSVITQECAFDMSMTGLETLQQDLVNAFEEWMPTCRYEGQYLHPGSKALVFAEEHGEDNFGCHNTDAHLRSSVIGRNVTIVAVDGEMDLGEFGRIHFIDWDQTRGRTRTVQVMIIGE